MNKITIFSLFLVFLLGTRAPTAPLTFDAAMPISKDERVFRQVGKFLQKESDAGAKVSVRASMSVLGHAFNEKTSLFAIVPYLDKELDTDGAKRKASGIGDARLFARYITKAEDSLGRTKRNAYFAGIKVPTGDWKDTDAQGKLPRPLQTGTGSWDGFFGYVYTVQTFDHQWDLQGQIDLKGERDGYQFGHEFHLDAAYQHRLYPKKLALGVPAFLYAVAELNMAEKLKDKLNGASVATTGGFTMHFTAGFQYVTKRWVAEGGALIPLAQDLPAGAMEDNIGYLLSYRHNL